MTRSARIGPTLVVLAFVACGGGGPRANVTSIGPSLAPSQIGATESPPATPTATKGLTTPPWTSPWRTPEPNQWVWVRAEPGLLLLSYGGNYACCANFSLRPGGVAAVDPKDGHELWRHQTAAPAFPAVLTGSTVVFGTGDGTVFGVDASTGRTLWQRDFAGIPFQVLAAASTVVVADADPEIWGPGGMVDKTRLAGRVEGLDRATGAKRWETKVGASSALAAADGETLVVAAAQGADGAEIAAFDTSTGSARWRQGTDHVPSPPVIAGKLVLVPGARLAALELASGKQVWAAEPANGGTFSFPVVLGDVVLAGSNTHTFESFGLTRGASKGRSELRECEVRQLRVSAFAQVCGSIALIQLSSTGRPSLSPVLTPQGHVQSADFLAGVIYQSNNIGGRSPSVVAPFVP